MKKFSIGVLTHNEGIHYLDALLTPLLPLIDEGHEIVIVDDFSDDESTVEALRKYLHRGVRWYSHHLNDNFSAQKNFLNSLCTGDWILNLDADEQMSLEQVKLLMTVVYDNPDIEAYWLPRLNVVNGITAEHINKWGWQVSIVGGREVIQWPDYQCRLYMKNENIKWTKPVHEQLVGFTKFSRMPQDPDYAILHIKDIVRQESQNNFYNSMAV